MTVHVGSRGLVLGPGSPRLGSGRGHPGLSERYMSYSLNSVRGGYTGNYMGDYYWGIKGDTRSLDYSSHGEF